MLEVNVKELRTNLRQIIQRVEAGEEVLVTRRGKPVARLSPPPPQPKQRPELSAFRASIKVKGESLSETVIRERREARY